MPIVYAIDGLVPVVDPSSFVHPRAVLIGDVIVGPGCYIGPGASMRGDFGRLIMEEGSNLQDNCVMHGFPGTDTVMEAHSHIGHGAVLHGCRIGRNALIGMNAVVMDEAEVGAESIVAAMAFVKACFKVPPRTLAAGIPAKVMRDLKPEEIAWKGTGTREYQELCRRSLRTMRAVEALTAPEPGRQRLKLEDTVPLAKFKERSGS